MAAPGDSDDELVPDDDDVAFVKSHRGYGAFFGERLEVEGIRVATKRRKKGPDEDDVTAEYERAPRTVTSGKILRAMAPAATRAAVSRAD